MKKLICTLFLLACGFFTAASPSDGNVVSTSGQLQAAALRTPIEEGNDLYGLIVDTEGAPVEGVVVSDGFTCVASDANGIYQMARNKDAFHVYYRIPTTGSVTISHWGHGNPSRRISRFSALPIPKHATQNNSPVLSASPFPISGNMPPNAHRPFTGLPSAMSSRTTRQNM